MTAKINKSRRNRGMTIIEILIAMVVLSIAMIGTMGYRYQAALGVQKADMRMTASQLGQMLCEGWRGAQGSEYFDPLSLGTTGAMSTVTGPTTPDDFTQLGYYVFAMGDACYYATLSWKDVRIDLRALNVSVTWESMSKADGVLENTEEDTIRLTTYIIR